ncbi:hypothetical protein FGIG_11649 [Fasciola gigantica]|uniref:Uncharacterized protein n=1 Tax=Fasciola gigantica TaxID=46835 RepID=A0A504YC14_FASGI|nr:hypothetical protein FGIG_11649 [Fasciola gigantica]
MPQSPRRFERKTEFQTTCYVYLWVWKILGIWSKRSTKHSMHCLHERRRRKTHGSPAV